MAKVDVLLPFWGDVELFKKAVLSVQAQTETDWRLVILDDHYPSDEPAKFIASLDDKRIVYRRHEKNIGITNNFNAALDAATTQHCVIFGCDDIMLPNYLEQALKTIGDADFYQPGVAVIDQDGTISLPLGDRVKRLLQPKKSGLYSGEKLAASLCTGNWLYFPSIMWKTETARKYGFNPRYKIAEDVELELNILKDGGSLAFDTTTTFQYRRSAVSLSSKEKSKGGVRFTEEDAVYAHFAEVFTAQGWHKAARAAKLRLTSRLHKLIA